MLRLLSSNALECKKNTENHLNLAMLVFIEKLLLSTNKWVPMCQGFSYFLSNHVPGFQLFFDFSFHYFEFPWPRFQLFFAFFHIILYEPNFSQQQPNRGYLQKLHVSLQTSLNCFMAYNIDQLSTLSHCLSITRCGMCVHRWSTLFVSRKRLP